MCTFAGVVGAARDKNHNSFSARGGKKVVHHWIIRKLEAKQFNILIPHVLNKMLKTLEMDPKKKFSMFHGARYLKIIITYLKNNW